jgi:hypothetical protein
MPITKDQLSELLLQMLAAECVVHAETTDHLNWELLGEAAQGLEGDNAKAMKDALKEVEEQEDEHLYHSTGWCRELWIESLGLPAVLPPPEEEKDVKTAISRCSLAAAPGNLMAQVYSGVPVRVAPRRRP